MLRRLARFARCYCTREMQQNRVSDRQNKYDVVIRYRQDSRRGASARSYVQIVLSCEMHRDVCCRVQDNFNGRAASTQRHAHASVLSAVRTYQCTISSAEEHDWGC